jgi:hypothetical protein
MVSLSNHEVRALDLPASLLGKVKKTSAVNVQLSSSR